MFPSRAAEFRAATRAEPAWNGDSRRFVEGSGRSARASREGPLHAVDGNMMPGPSQGAAPLGGQPGRARIPCRNLMSRIPHPWGGTAGHRSMTQARSRRSVGEGRGGFGWDPDGNRRASAARVDGVRNKDAAFIRARRTDHPPAGWIPSPRVNARHGRMAWPSRPPGGARATGIVPGA